MIPKKLKKRQFEILKSSPFDSLSFALIDFKKESFISWAFQGGQELDSHCLIFDLASLTKPLTLGVYHLFHEKDFSSEWTWLLEHRGGLPAYGPLSQKGWQDQIKGYLTKESDTLYSDFSALRLMLEIGEKKLKKESEKYHEDLWFWLDLNEERKKLCVDNGQKNRGDVHDPNAFNLKTYTSHAGLFGTGEGVAKTLLRLNQEGDLLSKNLGRKKVKKHRPYFQGFDSVINPHNTLAGLDCGENTFGFLGFTGTCFWIDPEVQKGWVLLTNATQKYWHEREGLRHLRKESGKWAWSFKF